MMAKLSASAQERIIDYIAIVTTIMYVVILKLLVSKGTFLPQNKKARNFFKNLDTNTRTRHSQQ